MNDTTTATSAPGTSLLPDGIGLLTTIHFALIAILAALVVFGIVWGIRLRHRRRKADRAIVDHNLEVATNAANAAPDQQAPPPVAPAPPPATDEIVPGTPAPEPPLADEPIAAAAAGPAMTAAAPSAAPAAITGAGAPVTLLKGLGPKVAARLGELGVTNVGQLAALDPDDAAALDAQLGAFAGRMTRDRWIDQARFLATGDRAGFETVFGKL